MFLSPRKPPVFFSAVFLGSLVSFFLLLEKFCAPPTFISL